MSKPRRHADDLRAATRLVVQATKGVTDVVEAMHHTIASGPRVLGRPLAAPSRLFTGLVYGSIRGITGLTGAGIDALLAQLAPVLGESTPGPERDALIAALNGVIGDTLADAKSPLAIPMQMRRGGAALELTPDALAAAIPDVTGKLVVLVHGSSMNDRQWTRAGHDHGAALARDLGYTPVYLFYDTGMHISTNGRLFAAMLERLLAAWPVPIEAFSIIGHSMGGLVARSACYYGEQARHTWRTRLQKLACLGSPHHGAALERGGNWFETVLQISRYSAPLAKLGKMRSAGVTDMRFGSVRDDDWQNVDRFVRATDARAPCPLPQGVECYAIAATTARDAADTRGGRFGDGLVSIDSALGRHARPELSLGFPEAHTRVLYGTGHLDLLNSREAYDVLRQWFTVSR